LVAKLVRESIAARLSQTVSQVGIVGEITQGGRLRRTE